MSYRRRRRLKLQEAPVNHIWVPKEQRRSNGNMTFRTHDGTRYERDAAGVIRRIRPAEEKHGA